MAKTLMLYYTFEGNTGFVAEQMKANLDLTLEQLIAENEPPKKGLGKFLRGGASALFRSDPALFPLYNDPNAFDNVILAFPVWAGTYPPAVAAMIEKYPFAGKNLYIIACSAGGRAEKAIDAAADALSDNTLCGSLSLVSPLKNRTDTIVKLAAFARLIQGDTGE